MTQGPPTQKLVFAVRGMDCGEEVAALKREVGPLVGGEDSLSFDLLNGRMTVRPPGDTVSPRAIQAAVRRAGLTAEPWSEGASADDGAEPVRRGRLMATTVSGVATALGLSSHAFLRGGIAVALGVRPSDGSHEVPGVSMALYGIAIACGLAYVAPKAWAALLRLRSDMNLLMTVAVVGAVLIGEWFEAATVSFLFALSLALESWSVGRARRAVSALLDLAPPRVRVLHPDGTEVEQDVEGVPTGTAFLVRPGERIPLDGTIERGNTAIDEAPITGESVPRDKGPGSEVFAGTVNGSGAIEVRSRHPARDTVLARIIRSVGEAQERRARLETWVDAFARVYTPVVMLLAVTTALLPPLFLGAAWPAWLYKGLVLLVIACPCALVISTPVSIVAGLATAARHGVLIKGGIFLEVPARLGTIAFDKTGTITEGRQAVVEVIPLGSTAKQVLEVAAALESRSGHPIARAVVAHAAAARIEPAPARDVRDRPGMGVTGTIEGEPFWAGSHRLLEEQRLETDEVQARRVVLGASGRTLVIVGDARRVLGFIALADTVRPAARGVVADLRSLGVKRVVLLTGDNADTARAVADAVGIDDVRAELLPEEKVHALERLTAAGSPVAMVGDGVNDAPAMARADVGIAMGAAGSDAAVEAADIALMADDLTRLPWLIRHSRRTLRVIRQNIVFAIAVKVVFASLAVLGYASLWAAIGADMGASLLVIGNGLRLLSDRR